MSFKDAFYHEVGRREAYKGFSECFLLPHEDFDTTLKNLEQHLEEVDSSSKPLLEKMSFEFLHQNGLDGLKMDFTKLFIGPYCTLAPPYGSNYLEEKRKIMGESTIDVLEKYHAGGMIPSTDFKDVPDHISTELEFMYFLIYKETKTLVSETPTAVLECFKRQKEFLNLHIGRWIVPFVRNILTHAQTDFYKNLASAVDLFIKEDIVYVDEIFIGRSVSPAVNSQSPLREVRPTTQSL